MSMDAGAPAAWWAEGLLFENCNCQLVCPGHVHFDQQCTHDRCVGYWAIRFDAGRFGAVDLGGLRAVIAYDSPRHMIEGGWTETLILDRDAPEAQRAAGESILTGRSGGPWEVLARFVARRLPTRLQPIRIEEEGSEKRVRVEGMLDARIEEIRGRDRSRPVAFDNMFNQIHAPSQVIARGTSLYDDGEMSFDTRGTHALHSRFSWRVGPAGST